MTDLLDGTQMTTARWVAVGLIMIFVWGVLIAAAMSAWRGPTKRRGSGSVPNSRD